MARTLSSRRTHRAGSVLSHLVMIALSCIFALPLFWMLSTSLKGNEQLYTNPPTWVPHPLVWSNYSTAVSTLPFFTFLTNTVIVTTLSVIGTMVSCSLVAYGFARIPWRGRNAVFALVLATLLLPYPVVMIPVFLIFSNLGWIDTLQPLWVPTFFGNAFYIFLLRQFFMNLPLELSEAARIDGANEFTIYWRIVLPLARPALTTVAIFSFFGAWNDFLGPLIYLDSQEHFTLAIGLNYFIGLYQSNWQALMAYSTLMTLPLIVLFFAAQRTFIRGIALTGING